MQVIQNEYANLTPKQIKCLPLIAIGCTAIQVSKKIKVSQAQISEWRRDQNFMSALESVRRNALRDAEIALASLAINAVDVLRESLKDSTNGTTRLKASMFIIDRLCLSSSTEPKPSGSVNMAVLISALGTQPGSPQ